MADRIVLCSERSAQTIVNDVEHTESQSVNGTAVVKYFFQPNANQELSLAQIIAVSQTSCAHRRPAPPRPSFWPTTPRRVPDPAAGALERDALRGSRSSISATTSCARRLATVAGASIPYPFGGKQRQVRSTSTREALRARGLVRRRRRQRDRRAESHPAGRHAEDRRPRVFRQAQCQPEQIEELNDLPIAPATAPSIYVRDVAHVRDGYPPQTNIVARATASARVLMSVLKTGNASTLDIISGIKETSAARSATAAARLQDRCASAISRCSCAPPSTAWSAKA